MLRSVFCMIIASLLVSGCGGNPFVKTVYVDVPTPVSCVSWEPTRESGRFAVLDTNAPVWEQVKALLIDRENDQQFIDGQQAVINGCK